MTFRTDSHTAGSSITPCVEDGSLSESKTNITTIFPLGDSITEGSDSFSSYRLPLLKKLHSAGFAVTYVGSRQEATPHGTFSHEGYGGQTTEFLADNIDRLYRMNPADIVLLHSGHNHDQLEKPIPAIIAATASILSTVRRINPQVIVLLARVIPSGKLPKYAYIPDLNAELAKQVEILHGTTSNIVLVNQMDGFDIESDTVADKVHPNRRGAEKMAARWFEHLSTILTSLAPTAGSFKQGIVDSEYLRIASDV